MGIEINQATEIIIAVLMIGLFAGGVFFYTSNSFNRNSNNKIMLKQLLERFDLDLPEELKEIDGTTVVKTIKSR